jgi:hypothetical protein
MHNIIFLTGHTYSGCFRDYAQRVLSDFHMGHDYMTNAYCAVYCCSQSHMSTYMGIEVYIITTPNILKPVETESCINRTLNKTQM